MRGVTFFATTAQALPFSTEYTTPGTSTVSIPSGAVTCTIECYGAGAGSSDAPESGGGGAYSQATTYDVSGLSALYLSVPDWAFFAAGGDAFVKENTSGGTTVCLAKGGGTGANRRTGGAAASGVGDTKTSGGDGLTGTARGGGGAGGPTSNGGNAVTSTGGSAGTGGVAGAGGEGNSPGNLYGGGAGSRNTEETESGAQGYIKLSWA